MQTCQNTSWIEKGSWLDPACNFVHKNCEIIILELFHIFGGVGGLMGMKWKIFDEHYMTSG